MKGYVDVCGGKLDLFDISDEIDGYIKNKKPRRIIVDVRLHKGEYVVKIFIPLKCFKGEK